MGGLLNVSYSAEENWLLFIGLIQPLFMIIQFAWSFERRITYARVPSIALSISVYHWLLLAYLLQLIVVLFIAYHIPHVEDVLTYVYFSYWLIWVYYCIAVSMKVYELKRNQFLNNAYKNNNHENQ